MGRHKDTPDTVGSTAGGRVLETRRSGEVLMAARLVPICVVVLVTMNPFASASDSVESGASSAVAAAVATTAVNAATLDSEAPSIIKPVISTKVSVKNRRKISNAFELALEKVREVPECGDLFTELGSDGLESLGRVIFLPIGRAQGRGGVCRGSSAYTMVGGGPVRVCREFSRLSDTQAAMVIIHEALHHAGLSEFPLDPDGLTSNQINGLVMESCGL
jgi:hypothetical protein